MISVTETNGWFVVANDGKVQRMLRAQHVRTSVSDIYVSGDSVLLARQPAGIGSITSIPCGDPETAQHVFDKFWSLIMLPQPDDDDLIKRDLEGDAPDLMLSKELRERFTDLGAAPLMAADKAAVDDLLGLADNTGAAKSRDEVAAERDASVDQK